MDNTQATTLNAIVDTHEFLENPLDVYESYTYNLEWFVVDIDADRRFQEFGETLNVVSIVKDGWPGVEDTKITIAKTGVTTEFNITDLTIEGSGAGIAETSKIAGTALNLDFTVTEVGSTSLVDNLQNAIALCGWKGIDTTHFYIKINFVGVDVNGKKVKIPQTKVLTFTLQAVTRLQSQTDAKGTTTVLQGTILQDSIIGNKLAISSTETHFSYNVAETLADTLGEGDEPKEGSFIDELNKSNRVIHPNLLENLQNTYKINMSKGFKREFGNSNMRGITSSTIINMHPQIASQVGQVAPLLNIFEIINDICLNALKIKEELTKDTPKQSKVFKIVPWLIPKKGGWNRVKGTMAYDVEFYIDYEKKIITQNPLDANNKAANINKTVKELFDEYHINKKYHYLFTGKNDQIIDFSITLDQYLAKTYSAPSDWYAYENILKAGTVEGNKLLDGMKDRWKQSSEAEKDLIAFEKKWSEANVNIQTKLKNSDNSLRNDMLSAYESSLIVGGDKAGVARKKLAEAFFKGKSFEEMMAAISKDVDNQFVVNGFLQRIASRKKLQEQAESIQEKHTDFNKSLTAHRLSIFNLYKDWMASSASVTGEENWKNGVKQNAQKLLSGVANKNPKNMILLEELDDDIMSKMTTENFESVLKSQAKNPIVYESLIRAVMKNKGTPTLKPTDVENVDLARAKYYESKSGHASMIHARMTIKGDPHWVDGYMPPAVAKREFGEVGAVSDKGYSMQTTGNGYNYLILESGVAAGTDLHDNVLKRNLLTHLYTVTGVTSDFSGGVFTQTLTLNRLTDTDDMATVIPIVGPALGELDDKNPIELQHEEEGDAKEIILTDEAGRHIDANQGHYLGKLLNGDWGPTLGEILASIKRFLLKPFNSRTIGENTAQYRAEMTTTGENAKTLTNNMTTPNISWAGDAITRQANAGHYLNQHKLLKEYCNKGGDELSCKNLADTRNNILEPFGFSIADISQQSTITSMNTQINDSLANYPNLKISQYEVAMWQHAVGGELDICRPGDPANCFTSTEDKEAIERIIRDTTKERTPETILNEQKLIKQDKMHIIKPYDLSSGMYGAIIDNKILDGSLPLCSESLDGKKINGKVVVPIRTDAEFAADDAAINALPDVPASEKTKKWILLGKEMNYALKGMNVNGEIVDATDVLVTELCAEAAGSDSSLNTDRTLNVNDAPENTLIDLERLDINTLGAAVNSIIKKNLENELSAEDTNTQKKWEEKANVLLAQQLALKELVITEEEKDEIQTKIKSTVTESVLLGSMSDDDHRKIQGYADGINTIISDATGEDHRGDLTTAVNVGITEDELVALTETRAETKTKLNQYFWNTNDRRVWEGQLEDTEVEIAEHMLGMPDENMTAVATVISGLNKTYIPIFNPTSRLNDQPAIIKNPDGQFDVVLAGKDNTYAGVTTQDNLDQLSEAKNLFYHLTRTDTEMITFEDDMGLEFDVKDFSNISSYTLSNGTVISTPSSTFGIYTMDPNNMVPANKQDYRLLREKVADYFPNIEVISNIDLNGVGLTLSTLKDNTGIVILNGTAFYISP